MQTTNGDAPQLVEDVAGKPLPDHKPPEDAVDWRTDTPPPHPGENHAMLIVVMVRHPLILVIRILFAKQI